MRRGREWSSKKRAEIEQHGTNDRKKELHGGRKEQTREIHLWDQ